MRAPGDGYVPQFTLRPGQMATPVPLKPLMVFVETGKPVLLASYKQKTLAGIEPGLEAEAVFKAYPGRSFQVKVRSVMTAIPEGEILASGELLAATSASDKGYVPVVFEYDEDVAGAQSARRRSGEHRDLHAQGPRAVDRPQDHPADEELGELPLLTGRNLCNSLTMPEFRSQA